MRKLKSLLISILAYLAAACTPIGHPDPRPFRSIGAEFKPYVADFQANYGWVVTTPIGFVDQLPNGKLGVCNVKIITEGFPSKTYTYKYIAIKRSFWDKASDIRRLAIIYHELIHCEFEVEGHLDDMHVDNCPTNIMSTYLPSDYCLNTYFDSYVKYWQ